MLNISVWNPLPTTSSKFAGKYLKENKFIKIELKNYLDNKMAAKQANLSCSEFELTFSNYAPF